MKYFFEFLMSKNFLIIFFVLCIIGGIFKIVDIENLFNAISTPVLENIKDLKNLKD